MKTKNILTLALSLCLVAVIAVGGTLAYFTTTTSPAQNVFTAGEVAIELVDQGFKLPTDEADWTYVNEPGGVSYSMVAPGNQIGKNVSVKIDPDSLDCYVAVKVEFSSTVAGLDMSEIIEDICEVSAQKGWLNDYDEAVGGNTVIFYQPEALTANGAHKETSLFSYIHVPTSWGNEIQDKSFTINVSAAAVQTVSLEAPAMVDDEENPGAQKMNDAMKTLHDLLVDDDGAATTQP